MADNVAVAADAEYTVSTDEGAGGHVQRVKLTYSADGSETHVSADADGLLVNLGANNDVSVTGNVAVTHAALTELAAAIDTEVQVDVVGALPAGDNNIGNVDVASSALPTGAATSANQTTVIGHLDGVETLLGTIDADTGSIATSASTIAGAVSGTEMQVDVVSSALPSGAATAANQTTIIGHLDGVEGLLTTIDGDTGTLAVTGGGTETGALRVTIANNSTGVVSVDDNGGSLTVDGTVAVTGVATAANQTTIIGHVDGIEGLLTTIDADTGGILTAVQTLDNAISGSEMQVDVVAALPAGTNNIGDVDVATLPSVSSVANSVALASTTASQQVLASNSSRKGLVLQNTDANGVYIKFGTTASATDFHVFIPGVDGDGNPVGIYTMDAPIYTGRIDAIWAGNGSGSLYGAEL